MCLCGVRLTVRKSRGFDVEVNPERVRWMDQSALCIGNVCLRDDVVT